MELTTSGNYKLPGRLKSWACNCVLKAIRLVPSPLRNWFYNHHQFYQRFESGDETIPGSSAAKWQALGLPEDLSGSSVIDIGCSEGYFCLQAAKQGASPVLGVDGRWTALICARILSIRHKVNASYRVATFPNLQLNGEQFDYVLCLSVLHHFLSTKDIWKVVSEEAHAENRNRLSELFRYLHEITRPGGRCIVEIPYEYDDPADSSKSDFSLFNQFLLDAGFSEAEVKCQWDHDQTDRKDRVVYVGRR